MSAHRKPGPALLDGRTRRGKHSVLWWDTSDVIDNDLRHMLTDNLTEEQQREADRVAGEGLRLSWESLRLTFPPGMTVVPKSTPPSVNQTVTGGGS